MKKVLPLIAMLLQGISGYCQEAGTPAADTMRQTAGPVTGIMTGMATANAEHPLRTNNEVTPRWSLDANFRYGGLKQNIETFDLTKSYEGSLPYARYTGLSFSNKNAFGGDLGLSYYFNKKHTLGVGIGVMYMQFTGTLTMDSLHADYKDMDSKGRIYRQLITSTGRLSEDVTTQTLNVPVLFRFKNQFKKKFGIWGDIGPVFGLYNSTKTTHNTGSFDFEAIYRLSGESSTGAVSGFDESVAGDPSYSLVLTKTHLLVKNDASAIPGLLDDQRNKQGYNVGLGQAPAQSQNTPTNKYNKISIGGIVQAGVSWEITYRLAFNLGGYYMYQHYDNKDQEKKHITDRIINEGGNSAANYNGLSSAIHSSDYSTYGAMAGIRVFLGGKGRDTDGDGYTDDIDGCKFEWGKVGGCPDDDHDGIPNDEDECRDLYGPAVTRGCPDADGDGFPDKADSCVNLPGSIQGCPAEYWAVRRTADTTLVAQNGTVMAPHIVLETDVLQFSFGKATLEPAAEKILGAAANALENNPKVIIHLSGYTDDIGSYANNLVLSLERAKSARAFLKSLGVPEERIIIAGLGKDNPVSENNSDENRAKNRRIEMKLLLPVQ